MFKHFLPDREIEHYCELTPEALSELGVRLLITDVDNTLVPYDNERPTEEVKRWIESFKKAGIDVAILSNNGIKRVELFNRDLGLFAVHKSGKPKRSAVGRITEHFGVKPEETAFLGDQLFTDVLCGRRAGAYTVLTDSISEREGVFVKLKRVLEIPIRRKLGLRPPKIRKKKDKKGDER
ncbi:MAG: YqeG family HAD IIIA-type phosphatase [Clostridia bacterium]|nr:YqeG family HAD IIIA-type phosphatase [Clostridia bacterium]